MNNLDRINTVKSLVNGEVFTEPFNHLVIDNFLPTDLANKLFDEFPDFEDSVWFNYNNKIEDKKLLSDWRKFPERTYQLLSFLNSPLMLETVSAIFNTKLYPDHGLHGGGWHIHANGGKLNPHLDYSIHPTLKQQRKVNLIIYLCKDWKEEYGGHFGLYAQAEGSTRAGNVVKEIPMGFNRAVLFDTTQQSWHGLSREVNCPDNLFRKSLAVYYLTDAPQGVDSRSRALFSPTADQVDDSSVLELIAKRSDIKTATEVYINKTP